MASGVRIKAGYFQVVADSDIAFDSRRPSIQLFPDSTRIVLNDRTISFPNLLSTAIYFNRSSDYAGTPINAGTTYAESYSALIAQEWGPSESTHNEVWYPQAPGNSIAGPSRRPLAQELLGSVPVGTTYLDVRVRLRRTKLPPIFMGRERPVAMFEENQWLNLPGGSCPVERFFPLARMFDIVRDGTGVFLRRYQSTAGRLTSTYNRLMAGGPLWVSGGNTSGWRHNNLGTATWAGAPSYGAWMAVRHQAKGPDTNGNKRAPWFTSVATNPCQVPGYGGVPATDYSTTLSADIIIHPGRYLT